MTTHNRKQYVYAVHKGRSTGVFLTWKEAQAQVAGFPNAVYKKFKNMEEAMDFVKHDGTPSSKQHPHSEKDDLVVFTDGSSIGNGSDQSITYYAVVWPFEPSLHERHALPKGSTNNQAEYSACIRALEQAIVLDPSCKKPLHIYTDSKLLVNSMTNWIHKWKVSGWKNGSIKNINLLQKLDELCMQRGNVHWNHVSAHTKGTDWKSYWNDKVDRLARDGEN